MVFRLDCRFVGELIGIRHPVHRRDCSEGLQFPEQPESEMRQRVLRRAKRVRAYPRKRVETRPRRGETAVNHALLRELRVNLAERFAQAILPTHLDSEDARHNLKVWLRGKFAAGSVD